MSKKRFVTILVIALLILGVMSAYISYGLVTKDKKTDDDDVGVADPISCGDGICAIEETDTCAQDCPQSCGNNLCDTNETAQNCLADCGFCGDTYCPTNETLGSCVIDCAVCGDNTCSPTETSTNCAQDCGLCGNHVCDSGENSVSCVTDCAAGTCNDNTDNDSDGLVDELDPACHTDGIPTNASSYTPDEYESSKGNCADGIDNNSSGQTDAQDPDCHTDGNPNNPDSYDPDLNEDPITQCNDGIDNDGDTRVDCEAGNEDPGCFPDGNGGGGACSEDDTDEFNTICGNGTVETGEQCDDNNTTNGDGCSSTCQTTTQCNDGVDNDGDGRTDCATGNEDPGCFPNGKGGGGSCDPQDTTEPDAPTSCGDGILDAGEACDNGTSNANAGAACNTSCQLNVQCNDGIDNDGDGRTDCTAGAEDLGCFPDGNGGGGACATTDTSESNVTPPPVTSTQCNDGIDNDGDGRIDCVPGNEDLGCYPNGNGGGGACTPTDPSETNTKLAATPPPTPTQLPTTGVGESRFLLLGSMLLLLAVLAYKYRIGSSSIQSLFNYSTTEVRNTESKMAKTFMPFEEGVEKIYEDKVQDNQ